LIQIQTNFKLSRIPNPPKPLLTNRFYELLPNKSFILPRFSNYKTTGRWHKKVGVQNKGYQFKNTAAQPANARKNTFARLDQQEEKSIGVSMRKTLKKITNAIRKTHSYTDDKN
jgi:hypothetical protein